MDTFSEPFILEDKSRLPEIYKLRVSAYETSEKSEIINFQKYPDGWSDELDESGVHFVVTNHENIFIAAARANVINSISDLPFSEIYSPFSLPQERPFLFYSRLVIDKSTHSLRLLRKILDLEFLFLIKNNYKFGLTLTAKTTEFLVRFYNFQNLGAIDTAYYPYGNDNLLLLLNPNNKS